MKKFFLLAVPVIATAAFAIPVALAGNGSANMATGDYSYTNPWTGDATNISFVAQDLGNNGAKGNMTYSDSTGRSYGGPVIEAHVLDAKHASFTVRVAFSSFDNTPVGTLVPLEVADNGEPGVNDSMAWLHDGTSYDLGPRTAGNIQVHYKS